MNKKLVLAIAMISVLVPVLSVSSKAQIAQTTGTINIRADGSIDPSTAPISSVDNVTYTFMGNMSYPTYDGIVVERSNIVIDGNGYMVQGNYTRENGLSLTDVSNVTIENANVEGFYYGIYLNDSNNNVINCNNATANIQVGIYVDSSSNNTVSENNVTANFFDGIRLSSSSNNTVSGNNATANEDGIAITSSSYNTVSGNNATANEDGIAITSSSYNTVSGNNATANGFCGIFLFGSSGNALSGNVIEGNLYVNGLVLNDFMNSVDTSNLVNGKPVYYVTSKSNLMINPENCPNIGYLAVVNCTNMTVQGLTLANCGEGMLLAFTNDSKITNNNVTNNGAAIIFHSSSDNKIYHNNFVGNSHDAEFDFVSVGNTWDDGYPSGGNYWSDYWYGVDVENGLNQNQTGSDGIGDTPYRLSAAGPASAFPTDDYPLMGEFSTFDVAEDVNVQVVSNSTVSDFKFNGTAILFNVSGVNGTTGFCKICVSTSLLNGTLTVFVNETRVQYSLLPSSNSSISYLYFTYGHSTEQIIITPEFPSFLILSVLMIATLLAVITFRKKGTKVRQS